MAEGTVPSGGYQRRVEQISQAVVRLRVHDDKSDFEGVLGFCCWIGCAKRRDVSLPDAMLRGETDSLDLLGAQRVETVALEHPRVWATRPGFQDEPGTQPVLGDHRCFILPNG